MSCFFFWTARESGLPLLNPYKDRKANFSHGANFAVAGATALSIEYLTRKKIAMSFTNSSLSVQIDWMSSHFKSIYSPGNEFINCVVQPLINYHRVDEKLN